MCVCFQVPEEQRQRQCWRTIPPGSSRWSALSPTTEEQPCLSQLLKGSEGTPVNLLWHYFVVKVTTSCHKMAADPGADLAPATGTDPPQPPAVCVVQEHHGVWTDTLPQRNQHGLVHNMEQNPTPSPNSSAPIQSSVTTTPTTQQSPRASL